MNNRIYQIIASKIAKKHQGIEKALGVIWIYSKTKRLYIIPISAWPVDVMISLSGWSCQVITPVLCTPPEFTLHHHRSLDHHFGHKSAIFRTISLLFYWPIKYTSRSQGAIIHLRDSLLETSRSSIYISKGYELRIKVTDNRRSSSSAASSKREDCCRAITREAARKHISCLVIKREASVKNTLTLSNAK